MSATLRERIMHIISETSGCGCCAPPCPEEYLTEEKGWREGWQADQIIEAATPAIAAEPLTLAETREMQRRLSVLADRVTAEGADYPEAIITRVIDDELLAESLLSSADPDFEKRRQIAEDAWRDQLDDARSVRADWAWPA